MHVNTEGAAYLITTVDQTDGEVINTEVTYARLSDAVREFQLVGQVPVAVSLIERAEPAEEPPADLIPTIEEAMALGMLGDWAAEGEPGQ